MSEKLVRCLSPGFLIISANSNWGSLSFETTAISKAITALSLWSRQSESLFVLYRALWHPWNDHGIQPPYNGGCFPSIYRNVFINFLFRVSIENVRHACANYGQFFDDLSSVKDQNQRHNAVMETRDMNQCISALYSYLSGGNFRVYWPDRPFIVLSLLLGPLLSSWVWGCCETTLQPLVVHPASSIGTHINPWRVMVLLVDRLWDDMVARWRWDLDRDKHTIQSSKSMICSSGTTLNSNFLMPCQKERCSRPPTIS
jgi:hypothetical protein